MSEGKPQTAPKPIQFPTGLLKPHDPSLQSFLPPSLPTILKDISKCHGYQSPLQCKPLSVLPCQSSSVWVSVAPHTLWETLRLTLAHPISLLSLCIVSYLSSIYEGVPSWSEISRIALSFCIPEASLTTLASGALSQTVALWTSPP